MPQNTPYDRIREITDQLENGLVQLFESDQYRQWLTTMSRFHDYSLNNTILIAMQKPDATLVAGYSTWQKQFGRQVNKGEKAIRILAPAPYRKKVEVDKTDPLTGEVLFNPDGSTQKEVKEILHPAFKVVNVFDVSQTAGRDIPSLGVDELSGTVEQFELFFEALKRTCPVPIEFERISSHAKGYYHQVERRIAIQENMSQVQTIKTAIHEMAHQKLHAIDPDKKISDQELDTQTRNSKEVEAESVAYTICQHYGIDTSDYSFAYIAGWSHGKETPELKASLDTIRKAASEMITEIDGHLQSLIAEREMTAQESKEAAYRVGDHFLEIHEAADDCWDFTLYGHNYCEVDGGQLGRSGDMTLAYAVKEIVDYFQFSGQSLCEMDRALLGKLVELYDPEKTDEQILFMGKVAEEGFDPHAYWIGGQAIDLTAQHFSHEELEDMKYQAITDAIPKMLFTNEQWKEIESGIAEKADVSVYARPEFSPEQMKLVHGALTAEYNGYLTHEDVLSVADPSKSPAVMQQELHNLRSAPENERRPGLYPTQLDMQTDEPQLYRYYSTQRPVDLGTYPKASDNMPVEIQNFDSRQPVEKGQLQAWGYVEYAKPLTEQQVNDYELCPVPGAVMQGQAASKARAKAPQEQNAKKKSVLADLYEKQAQIAGADVPKGSIKSKSKEME